MTGFTRCTTASDLSRSLSQLRRRRPAGLSACKHRLVRAIPVTGQEALYVNGGYYPSHHRHPGDESSAILRYLYQHMENPLFQCRFRWSQNAIAFWDNGCAQHGAVGITGRTPGGHAA